MGKFSTNRGVFGKQNRKDVYFKRRIVDIIHNEQETLCCIYRRTINTISKITNPNTKIKTTINRAIQNKSSIKFTVLRIQLEQIQYIITTLSRSGKQGKLH